MKQNNSKDIETFYPETVAQWRQWLQENHQRHKGIWIIQYNKKSGQPTVSWTDAVDEALCFGWIDSLKKKRDKDSSIQYFGKRKANSTWSKINKQKIEKLIEENKMTPAGFDTIKTAKENGSWEILDSVEELTIPDDLTQALSGKDNAKEFFHGLSRSIKKMMLYWVISAKKPETRQKRILEIAEAAEKKKKPKQF